MSSRWLVLTATLPTSPSGLRVRVWRSLKATGAGTLREGVYVLPEHAETAAAFPALEQTIRDAGAQAWLLAVESRDDAQEAAFGALFDRSEPYADLVGRIKASRKGMTDAAPTALRKALREFDEQLHAIARTDFFPGKAGTGATEALAALRRDIDQHLSPGEPSAREAAIAPLAIEDYQGRRWATRRRPWVDRLASAWLIQRFIDRRPAFTWLADPGKCPKGALGFDFDGAAFTHVGDRVTFEVLVESFGLHRDPALVRLGRLVHFIDVGGIPVDEAPGFEALVRGLQLRHPDDDALLAAAVPLLDAFHATLQASDEH